MIGIIVLIVVTLPSWGGGRSSLERSTYQSFRSPSLRVDGLSNDVATADVDGDGDSDVLVLNTTHDQLLVFISAENRQFAEGVAYDVGKRPVAMSVADIDRDGALDVVVVSSVSDELSILQNDGNGKYERARRYLVGDRPTDVEAVDLNGDGEADVAVVSEGSRDLWLLLSTRKGGHHGPVVIPLPIRPSVLAAGDIDGDRDIDLVIGSKLSAKICILVNERRGRFRVEDELLDAPGLISLALGGVREGAKKRVAYSSDVGVFKIELARDYGYVSAKVMDLEESAYLVAARVDDDDVADLLVSGLEVRLLFGKDDSWREQQGLAYGLGGPIASGDFDGDGKIDLVVLRDRRTPAVLFGDGSGFGGWVSLSDARGLGALVEADVDGDAKPELLVTSADEASILVFGKTVRGRITLPEAAVGIVAGDTDGDGASEVLVGLASESVLMLERARNGEYLPSQKLQVDGQILSMEGADLNKDGLADLLVTSFRSDRKNRVVSTTLTVFLGTRKGTRLSHKYPAGPLAQSLLARDVNGDGLQDIVYASYGADEVAMRLGNGDGTLGEEQTIAVGMGPRGLGVGDFDCDGVADIAVAHEFERGVWMLFGDGEGTFGRGRSIEDVGRSPSAVVTADFNGDGCDEVAVADEMSSQISIASLVAEGSWSVERVVSRGVPVGLLATDFDVDGAPDIVVTEHRPHGASVIYNHRSGRHGQPVYEAGDSGRP